MAARSPEYSTYIVNIRDAYDAELPVLQSSSDSSMQGRTRGKVFLPLILTAVTILFTAGLGACLLVWLVTHHAVQNQTVLETLKAQRAFVVDEGTRNGGTEARLIGLTISSIASSLIGVTIPFMMTLYAYRIASAWISSSSKTTSPDRTLPTPLQYGLVVRLLGSSSFLGLVDASAYLLRRRRPIVPLILTTSFLVCVLVFTLAHLASLTDIWIHSSTHAILGANFTSQVAPQAMTVEFNNTICENASLPTPCLQGPDSWGGGEPSVRNGGFLLAANASTPFKLVTLSDYEDTALVVPAVVNTTTHFNATSFASRAQCTSLNPQCQSIQRDGMTVVESCANVGHPELPYWGTDVSAIRPIINGTVLTDPNSIQIWPEAPNPFNLIVQLRWPTLAEDASVLSPNSAVDSDDANSTMSLYATCTFTFLNATYSYRDGVFEIIHEEVTNSNVSNIFWGPMLNQLANPRLSSDLQATAQAEPNADNVMALLRQDLSRIGLGMIGGVFIASSVLVQQEMVTTKTLAQYDAVPVFVFVGILCLYSLIALYIFVATLLARAPALPKRLGDRGAQATVSQLDLAHARLTSPLPLVADLFRPNLQGLAAQLSTSKSPMEMFEESSKTSRLVVGLGEGKFPSYGVRRRFEYEDDANEG